MCLCNAGYYGIGSCTRCPDGSMSNIGTATIDGCGCLPGTYGMNGKCNNCPPGYTSQQNSKTISECTQCYHGEEVVDGKCTPCRKGYWGVLGICYACPNGKTTDWEGATREIDCH